MTISPTKNNNFNVKIVSAFYDNLLKEVRTDENGQCYEKSRACQIPIKNGSRLLRWRGGCCAGKSLDLMEAARKRVGFTYTLYIVEDGKWGNRVNGSWNGLIRDVVDGKADFVMQLMNVIKKRAEDVEFTPAYKEKASYGILRIKKNEDKLPNWGFLEPISFGIKLAILVACVIAIVL